MNRLANGGSQKYKLIVDVEIRYQYTKFWEFCHPVKTPICQNAVRMLKHINSCFVTRMEFSCIPDVYLERLLEETGEDEEKCQAKRDYVKTCGCSET